MKRLLVIGIALCAGEASARGDYLKALEAKWKAVDTNIVLNKKNCNICHVDKDAKGDRNAFGKAVEAGEPNPDKTQAWAEKALLKLETAPKSDADKDGCPDVDEIKATPQTDPSDATKKPANCPAMPPDAGMGGGAGGGGMAGGAGGGTPGAGGGTPGAGGGTPTGAGGGTPSGAGGGTPSGSGGGSSVQADGGTGGRPMDPGGCNTTGYGTLAVALGGLMLLRRRMR